MNIEIKAIRKSYGRKQVLRDITLSVTSGKCIGILGSNGSGKSTLLSILAGVQSSDGGEFLFDGRDLFKYEKQRALLVGYVPQGTPLIEELTAKDNLFLWYTREEMQKELDSGILKMLGIGGFLSTQVSKMSGGMKKRLAIGCAIAKRPPILILDEPMAALDIACKQSISEYIKRHKQEGGIVLISTHDLIEMELCDEQYIIKNGVLNRFDYNGNLDELVKSL